MTKLADVDLERVERTDPLLAEQLVRRATLEQNVKRFAQKERRQSGDSKAAESIGRSIGEALAPFGELAKRLAEREPEVNLEGTKAPLADRYGGLAESAVQAKRGGIGVIDSNTNEDAPDMSFGQGPGHSHPDLRPYNEEEAKRATRAAGPEIFDPTAEEEQEEEKEQPQRRRPGRPRREETQSSGE